MLELSRTVRFCVGHDGSMATDAPITNSFAAWPPMRGLGSYYELEVTCRGEADPRTGYFLNIKHIDQAVRDRALPLVGRAVVAHSPPAGLLSGIIQAISPDLGDSVASVALRLTPTYALQMDAADMRQLLVSQQFDFSAAHRLHVPDLSDAENLHLFGKCNNPAGHGHNYRLEVTVRAPTEDAEKAAAVERLEGLVDESVIRKLDHKHLNEDVPQFADLNPSVENIARVVWEMLQDPSASAGLPLEQVRIWETEKTVCTYRG